MLERARTAGVELSKAATELNSALTAFQEALCAFDLGIAAYVELSEPIDDVRMLSFERIGDRWCIAVSKGQGDIRPLLNASRAVRIATAPLMTALLSALVAKAELACVDALNAKAS